MFESNLADFDILDKLAQKEEDETASPECCLSETEQLRCFCFLQRNTALGT
jgi:hypothetical protein